MHRLISIATVLIIIYTDACQTQSTSDSYGCECWRWPDCISNCTVNPTLSKQLGLDHQVLARFPTPFVIHFPYQVRDSDPGHNTSTSIVDSSSYSTASYVQNTKFWIQLLHRRHVQVELFKSTIFGVGSTSATHVTYWQRRKRDGESDGGDLFASEYRRSDHCFYTGIVSIDPPSIDPGSYAAVDTCHGLRGLIRAQNVTFGILPLRCTQCRRDKLPHIVFTHPPTIIDQNASVPAFWPPANMLTLSSGPRFQASPPSPSSSQIYSVQLRITLDHDLHVKFGNKVSQSVHYIGQLVNQATKSFIDLPIQLLIVDIELWSAGNRFTIDPSIKTTLNNLAAFYLPRSNNGPKSTTAADKTKPSSPTPSTDLHILLSATQFTDAVEYLAVPNSICTPRALAVVQVNTSELVYHVSRLLSLAVADVLGLKSFPCPRPGSCGKQDLFSRGDKSRLRLALLSGIANCLLHSSTSSDVMMRHDTCGNGQLDRGEECDPLLGDAEQLNSSGNSSTTTPPPCCNPSTCLVQANVECVHGACCRQCKLLPRGRLCRPGVDDCDLSEFCSGSQPDCPLNLMLENGSPCRSQLGTSSSSDGSPPPIDGLCYRGRCPTREANCQLIWGSQAQSSADYCYQLHNSRTDGACGRVGESCESEHAMCGLLHCQGGSDRAILPDVSSSQPFQSFTEFKGRKLECKYLAQSSHLRFVPNGAQCGESSSSYEPSRFCFQQRCMASSQFPLVSRCPSGRRGRPSSTNDRPSSSLTPPMLFGSTGVAHGPDENATCSGNGLCTDAGLCLCQPGWGGSACDRHITVKGAALTSRSGGAYLIDNNQHGQHSQLDGDIVNLIWAYRRRMENGTLAAFFADSNSKDQMNTLFLIAILGAVVGTTFLILALFILVYRFRHTGCSSFNSSSYSSNGRGNSSSYSSYKPFLGGASPNGHRRSFNDSSRRRSSHRDLFESFELIDDSTGGRRSGSSGRRHRGERVRKGRGSASDEGDERRTRRSSKRRGWHRRRHNGCGDDSVATEPFPSTLDDQVEDEGSVADRSIKFGSMPSYKEDKLRKVGSQSTTSAVTVTTTLTNEPTTTSVVATVANATNPQFPGGNGDVVDAVAIATNQSTALPIATQASTSMGSQLLTTTAPIEILSMLPVQLPNVVNNLETTANPAPGHQIDPPISSANNADTAVDQFEKVEATSNNHKVDLVMESSWRQPEKGILKNKDEGGGMLVTQPSSTKRRRSRSSRRRQRPNSSSVESSPRRRRSTSRRSSRSRRGSSERGSTTNTTTTPSSDCSTRSSLNDDDSSSCTSSSSECSIDDEWSRNSRGRKRIGDASSSCSSSNSSSCSDSDSTCSRSTAFEVGANGFRTSAKNGSSKSFHSKNRSSSHRASDSDDHHHRRGKKSSRHSSRHRSSSRPRNINISDCDARKRRSASNPIDESIDSNHRHRNRHRHRRHNNKHWHKRNSRQNDVESGAGQSGGQMKVPTILCNAGQQTDCVVLHTNSQQPTAAITINGNFNDRSQSNPIYGGSIASQPPTGDDEDEWEEVECSESACEECQQRLLHQQTSHQQTVIPTGSNNPVLRTYQHPPQLQHSSNSSSSVSVNGSRPHVVPVTSNNNNAGWVVHPGMTPRPVGNGTEEITGQSSEPEVDAHLQLLASTANKPVALGGLVTVGGSSSNHPSFGSYLPSPSSLQMSPESLGQRRYHQPSSNHRTNYPLLTTINGAQSHTRPISSTTTSTPQWQGHCPNLGNQQSPHHLTRISPTTAAHFPPHNNPTTAQVRQSYSSRQHPSSSTAASTCCYYEEVCQDDEYANAELGRSIDHHHHRHQHRSQGHASSPSHVSSYSETASSLLPNPTAFPMKRNGEYIDNDDDCLSLDESQRRPGYLTTPSSNINPLLLDNTNTNNHGDDDDCLSEFSLSAYRRSNTTEAPNTTPGLRPLDDDCDCHEGARADDVIGASNDGTYDTDDGGSDTSSLPEPNCDLVQLAQLVASSGRPNPMLDDLARSRQQSQQQARSRPYNNLVESTTTTSDFYSPSQQREHGLPPHPSEGWKHHLPATSRNNVNPAFTDSGQQFRTNYHQLQQSALPPLPHSSG